MPDFCDGNNRELIVSNENACCGTFHVKGAQNYDWGMKNRLARIFNKKSGKTVVLALDHGYIMGPTRGLERLDLLTPQLADEVDVIMATRGAVKTCMDASLSNAIALRSSAGSSVLMEDMSKEVIGVEMEDALRMNAACIAIQAFIGSPNECRTISNICRAVDAGNRYGMPVLGVVAVGKEMERTTKYFLLATRMLAEFGAHIVKTYFCEDFEKVVNCCPVPIVMAGGKKLHEKDALTMTWQGIQQGAAGVDMGRNIFQSECPVGMARAISAIVHDGLSDKHAYELYLEVLNAKQ